jgi:hypothetical protein
MSKSVYVLTVTYHNPQGSPVIIPEVFDSLDGAKEFVKENWGVKLQRLTASYWSAVSDSGFPESSFTLRLFKRTVFKR